MIEILTSSLDALRCVTAAMWLMAVLTLLPAMIVLLYKPPDQLDGYSTPTQRLKTVLVVSSVGLALLVIVSQAIICHKFAGKDFFDQSNWWAQQPKTGLMLVWMILGIYIAGFKNARKRALSGEAQRVAPLVSRGSNTVARTANWIISWATWFAYALTLLVTDQSNVGETSSSYSWAVIGFGGLLLIFGPWILRTDLEGEAEPFSADDRFKNQMLVSREQNRREDARKSYRIYSGLMVVCGIVALAIRDGTQSPQLLFGGLVIGGLWLLLEFITSFVRHRKPKSEDR